MVFLAKTRDSYSTFTLQIGICWGVKSDVNEIDKPIPKCIPFRNIVWVNLGISKSKYFHCDVISTSKGYVVFSLGQQKKTDG